jgi:hypothetical protein
MGYGILDTGRDVVMFDDNSLEVALIYLRRVSMHTHRLVNCTQRRAELMTNAQTSEQKW